MKIEHLFLFLVLVIFLALFFRISGYMIYFNLNVSIAERKEARIMLNYRHVIDITERQNITAEIINTGSVTIEEEMFIRIYHYNRSLKPIGEYLDSLRILKPGERSSFRIVFVPETTGTYYIQAKARYNSRTVETWGRFDVIIYPILEYELQPPQRVERKEPYILYLLPPRLEIYTNETYFAYIGKETFIPLIVKNLGDREAFELKTYVSYPSGLDITITPPYIKILEPNQSSTILIRVFVPLDFSEGLYQLDLEIVGNETKASKKIYLNVTKFIPDIVLEYREKILSLELIASELKQKIFYLETKGYDTREFNKKLEFVINSLNEAKKRLEQADIENCSKIISTVVQTLSELLLEIETVFLLVPKAYPKHFIYVLVVVILSGIVIVLILYYKKKKEERPKLLRGIEVETAG